MARRSVASTRVEPYRRITLAVGLAMFVDSSLYLAILPLLPHYAHEFGLGTLGVAIVLSAYPAATPLVSLACIPLVPRIGARRIALASGVVMTLATIAFALAPNAEVLVGARFLQGIASGTVWTSSMAWVTHNAPPDRRGRESGIVMGMLSAGSIAGPGIGALAAWAGSAPAFLIVAVVSLVGVGVTMAAPAGTPVDRERDLLLAARSVLRQPFARAAMLVAVLDTVAFGAIDLLVPLSLDDLGVTTAAIAAAFTIGAVLGMCAGPVGGRLVDRIGAHRVAPKAAFLIALSPLPLAFALPGWAQLGMLVVIGPFFAVAAAAMYPLGSAGADAAGVEHIVVSGLMGTSWATGFTIAPLVAGAVAGSLGRGTAFAVASILCFPLLALIVANARSPAA